MNKRLTAQSWIDAGLKVLACQGFQALKAEPLAKALGVSRGSFYWHFADVDVFQCAVIDGWKNLATEAVIAEIEVVTTAGGRLQTLLQRVLRVDSTLENRMRFWATFADVAARAVAEVDQRRKTFVASLLEERGVSSEQASLRTNILYWVYLGSTLSKEKLAEEVLDQVVDELVRLALAPSNQK